MHELMVTESILEITLRHAGQAGAVRVTDLFLVVGDLSSIVDDSVQFYWDFVSEGTAAEGATLHFRRIPAEFACNDCDHTYPMKEDLLCPACGSSNIKTISGQEFYMEAIEITEEQSSLPKDLVDEDFANRPQELFDGPN